jgi:hypothetical protein
MGKPIRKIAEIKNNVGNPYHFEVGSLVNKDNPMMGKVSAVLEDVESIRSFSVIVHNVYIEREGEFGKENMLWKKIFPDRIVEYQLL